MGKTGAPSTSFWRLLCILATITSSAGIAWGGLPNDKMDYTDFVEMESILLDLADRHPDIVTLKSIGDSMDIPVTASTTAYDIYALRVGPVGRSAMEDQGDGIPSILFTGGIHGREWLTTESLIALAEDLVERAQDPGTPEYALLRRVAVWIIPMVNVGGRLIDDLSAGDPEAFYPPPGEVALGNTVNGWRHSADLRGCEAGTDIARNFSAGWDTVADAGCGWSDHYKGLAPFSTREATALKAFVQNHWICMAVDVHTTSQRLWNRWGAADVAGVKIKEEAVAVWQQGLRNLAGLIYDPPASRTSIWPWLFYGLRINDFAARYTLDSHHDTGGGNGQFTAWLEEDRHIQTFILELPIYNPRAGTDYYGHEFQYRSTDQSNSFHPSSSRIDHLIQESFLPMAKYFIAQADAPGRATTTGFVELAGRGAYAYDSDSADGGPSTDFAILAAKIGTDEAGAPGRIESLPATLGFASTPSAWQLGEAAYDRLYPRDGYHLHYWVQNNGEIGTQCSVTLTLRSRPHGSVHGTPWTVDATDTRQFSLGRREKSMDQFGFDLEAEREYEVTARVRRGWRLLRSDDFAPNDEKRFHFTTHWELPGCRISMPRTRLFPTGP